jgi:hypothetical protein
MISQGLPAEKEALLMQFLDSNQNSTFKQYVEFSRITHAPSRLLVLMSLPCHHPEDPEVVPEEESSHLQAQVTG